MKFVLLCLGFYLLCACGQEQSTPPPVKAEKQAYSLQKKQLPLRIKETITTQDDGKWQVVLAVSSKKALTNISLTLLEQQGISFVEGDKDIAIPALNPNNVSTYTVVISAEDTANYVRWSTTYTDAENTITKKFTAKIPRTQAKSKVEKEQPKERQLKLTPATPKQK